MSMTDRRPGPSARERQALIAFGALARAFLTPLWIGLHEADRTWNLIRELPAVPSTALCRHTCLFALRLLASLGQRNWQAASGEVRRSAMPQVPAYVGGAEAARHYWLRHPLFGWFDLAADQFGLPEIMLANPSDAAFAGYVERSETAPLRNLKRTIRNWEGRPNGSWSAADLERQAEAYRRLREEAGHLLNPMG